jgi:outer membrane protein W
MKNLIIILLIILSSLSIYGQNHFIGFKGGGSITNIYSSEILSDLDISNRFGFRGGLTYDYKLNKSIELGADILYSQRGYRPHIQFTDQFGNPINEPSTFLWYYNYLSVPLTVGLTTGNQVNGFINLGFVPSVLIDAKVARKGEELLNSHNQITKYDLGGLLEIGGRYRLSEKTQLNLSLAYQQSFNTLTNENFSPLAELKHWGVTLSLGIRYDMRREK